MSALPQQQPAASSSATPDLRVVSRPRHPGRFVSAALLVVAAGVFGVVSLNALAAEAAFEARTLEAEVVELSLRYDELTASVAALESPARVRSVAVDTLGMTQVSQPEFLVLDTELRATAEASRPAIDAPLLADNVVADPVKQALSRE